MMRRALISMQLADLFHEFPGFAAGANPVDLTGLTDDSRRVGPGFVFVAVRGVHLDGHHFTAEAVRAGAAVVVGEDPDPGLGLPYLCVPDSRRTLGRLAAAWHGHPARKLVMVGVTGTEGKTTTATLIHSILRGAGHAAGLITTVQAALGDRVEDTGLHVTTPDAMDLQAYLAEMVRSGLSHAVVEATSHGLAQGRLEGCDFDVAVVTHIEREHLDFHGTVEAYREAKAGLFRSLSETPAKSFTLERTAILNRDDSSFGFLEAATSVRVVSYGTDPASHVRLESTVESAGGTSIVITGPGYSTPVRVPLIGEPNARNATAAFAAGVEGLGVAPPVAAAGIAAVTVVPGRMELIEMGQPFSALVDFAHSPHAVRRALEVGRRLTRGRLIAVFGAVGMRDRDNRVRMAEASAELADLTVFTADDPRTESLASMLQTMGEAAAAKGAVEGVTFWRVPDRRDALRFAISLARPGDMLMALGKGHEQSMALGIEEYPWDDRTALRAALAEHLGVAGPPMPFLPRGA